MQSPRTASSMRCASMHHYLVAAGTHVAAHRRHGPAIRMPATAARLPRRRSTCIAPAVARALAARASTAHGPLPSDTVFGRRRRRMATTMPVVTMYHDQGQIAMKLLGFERGRPRCYGGLPVRSRPARPARGSDIVGRQRRNVEGLQSAFDIVASIATRAPLDPLRGEVSAPRTVPAHRRRNSAGSTIARF